MKPFVFESKQRNVLLGLIALGAVCLAASFFMDSTPNHTRFWTNLIHNSTFFTLIAFTATFALAATTIAYAGWHVAFKRIWEAMAMFLPFGLVMIAIVGIGAVMHWHHLYHWVDPTGDKILEGKSGFLNIWWYFGAILFGFIWYFFAKKLRDLSLAQDDDSDKTEYPWYRRMKVWAAAFLPIAGFSSAAAIWLWLMSIDAHWYSTMYAWYTTASAWVSAVAITILMLIYLKSKGYFTWVTNEHLHDLGKFLFAFSVFWTYLWFSQYMLIWYANVGEETIYFRQRMGEFPVLFYGNLLMNFVLPFLILIRNDTKRKFGTLGFTAALVLFGHWWDFFQMTKVGPYKSATEHHAAAGGHSSHDEHTTTMHMSGDSTTAHAGHEAGNAAGGHGAESHAAEGHMNAEHGEDVHGEMVAEASLSATEELEKINKEQYFHYKSDMTPGFGIPGLLEIGILLGFSALFVFVVFSQLAKASLLPKNEPYLEETLHHHS